MNKAKTRKIGYAIRRARLERGMTLETAARKLHCSPSQLSRIENGKRGADPNLVSTAFGIPASQLLQPCPHCRYDPPPGYKCTRCGTTASGEAPQKPLLYLWASRTGATGIRTRPHECPPRSLIAEIRLTGRAWQHDATGTLTPLKTRTPHMNTQPSAARRREG